MSTPDSGDHDVALPRAALGTMPVSTPEPKISGMSGCERRQRLVEQAVQVEHVRAAAGEQRLHHVAAACNARAVSRRSRSTNTVAPCVGKLRLLRQLGKKACHAVTDGHRVSIRDSALGARARGFGTRDSGALTAGYRRSVSISARGHGG